MVACEDDEHLCAVLGCSRDLCGRSWAVLGSLRPVVGGSRGLCEWSEAALRPYAGALDLSWGPCGRSWEMVCGLCGRFFVGGLGKESGAYVGGLGRLSGPLWAI